MTPRIVPVRGARLLVDADIVYPIRVCDFILTASTNGLLQPPIVSDTILDEALRNVAADRPDLDPSLIERRFANVRLATDGHGVAIPKRFVDDSIINPKDRHVIAAAEFHSVDIVVSNDRRLRREVGTWAKMSERKLVALSADALAKRMIKHDRAAVAEVVQAMARRMNKPKRTGAEVLAALTLSLPSLRDLEGL